MCPFISEMDDIDGEILPQGILVRLAGCARCGTESICGPWGFEAGVRTRKEGCEIARAELSFRTFGAGPEIRTYVALVWSVWPARAWQSAMEHEGRLAQGPNQARANGLWFR